MGTECHYFICDVGNREEVYQTAKAVREKVSSLEGSVLSSAGPRRRPAKEINLAWERVLLTAGWLFPGHLWGLSRGLSTLCVHACVLLRAGIRGVG